MVFGSDLVQTNADGSVSSVFEKSAQIQNEKRKMPKAENKLQHIGIRDPNINSRHFEFRIAYVRSKNKVVIISRPFDYECGQGVFMRLRPQEEFPIELGSVIQLGTRNVFILERFNTGLIASSGRRSNMEDSFIINHDL